MLLLDLPYLNKNGNLTDLISKISDKGLILQKVLQSLLAVSLNKKGLLKTYKI